MWSEIPLVCVVQVALVEVIRKGQVEGGRVRIGKAGVRKGQGGKVELEVHSIPG